MDSLLPIITLPNTTIRPDQIALTKHGHFPLVTGDGLFSKESTLDLLPMLAWKMCGGISMRYAQAFSPLEPWIGA